jgi:hypothetical protein
VRIPKVFSKNTVIIEVDGNATQAGAPQSQLMIQYSTPMGRKWPVLVCVFIAIGPFLLFFFSTLLSWHVSEARTDSRCKLVIPLRRAKHRIFGLV